MLRVANGLELVVRVRLHHLKEVQHLPLIHLLHKLVCPKLKLIHLWCLSGKIYSLSEILERKLFHLLLYLLCVLRNQLLLTWVGI